MKKCITLLVLYFLSFSLMADQSYYCPQNHGYINIGMSTKEVIAACGPPISHAESDQPLIRRIPVQQLIYNNQGTSNAFFGVWNVPTGSGGTSMQIDIVDNKVKAVQVNGADSNATTICNATSLRIGDPVGKVYGACGSPSVVNNTYINQVVPTPEKPQVWIYRPGEYQPSVSLTFVDGKLQSISN